MRNVVTVNVFAFQQKIRNNLLKSYSRVEKPLESVNIWVLMKIFKQARFIVTLYCNCYSILCKYCLSYWLKLILLPVYCFGNNHLDTRIRLSYVRNGKIFLSFHWLLFQCLTSCITANICINLLLACQALFAQIKTAFWLDCFLVTYQK